MKREGILHRIAHGNTQGVKGVVSGVALLCWWKGDDKVLSARLKQLRFLGFINEAIVGGVRYFFINDEGKARLTCECFGGAR